VRGHPSSKHVCSTARLTARPHALRPCARQPRGCHSKWNEHLYRSARRRPQLNPRGPAAAGHLQIRACYTSLLLAACNRTRKGAFSAGHQMRTVPMFASPVVYTRRSSALAAQLRRKYFGTRQFSSRDLAVQHDEHHPCWKAAHFLPCTRPPVKETYVQKVVELGFIDTEVKYLLLRACSSSAAFTAAGLHTHVRTHRTSSDPAYLHTYVYLYMKREEEECCYFRTPGLKRTFG
jgi:hypothetical protein